MSEGANGSQKLSTLSGVTIGAEEETALASLLALRRATGTRQNAIGHKAIGNKVDVEASFSSKWWLAGSDVS